MKLWQNIFMQKWLLFILIPLVFSDERLEFRLSCELLQQTIISLENGKSKKYSGFKDDLVIGDIFYIDFVYSEFDKNYPHKLKITSNWLELDEEIVHPKEREMRGANKDQLYFKDIYKGQIDKQSTTQLSNDKILINNYPFDVYRFNRYYLNDWELIYFDIFDGFGLIGSSDYKIVTANCMRMPDDYSAMIEKIIKNLE